MNFLKEPRTETADALAIWQAAVDGVAPSRLLPQFVKCEGDLLTIADEPIDLANVRRIAVVGAGKASAAMAKALERALGPDVMRRKNLTGWVNVPADCVEPLSHIRLHSARPAGMNEPTEQGVLGVREIIKQVRSLTSDDLCFCLISGGASAMMPSPVEEITLADKLAVTQFLSAAGANIRELNTVRKQLSRIKGGGLARACRAGRLIGLVVSDVLGDPLDIIASGPTVIDRSGENGASEALAILDQFGIADANIGPHVMAYLKGRANELIHGDAPTGDLCDVTNIVIGNIATAVDAAGAEAERRGYRHAMHAATELEGEADQIGVHLAQMALKMQNNHGPDCLITGGEPIVKLIDSERRGLGGRNQQLVLAAAKYITNKQSVCSENDSSSDLRPDRDFVILSGGTDGEDGPTDAAGAYIDQDVLAHSKQQHLSAADFLARNDAYHFFESTGGLIKTGPTGTNVCDVRVVIAGFPPARE